MTAYRKLEIDGEEFVFSDGFTDLHTECYRDILAGGGYGPADARAAIATLAGIRRATPVGPVGDCHPWALRMA
jgi:UDP-N-acetyl-2-amino-2-deoxyglucuronate dehydrogenase